MGTVQVKNNAYSTLASGITNVATSLTVATGHGARFPAVTTASTNYFYATLIDTSNNLEVVKVTNVSTDTFTIIRAQDGTTALAYSAGDRIELRVTAALLSELPVRAIVTGDYTDGSVTYAKIESASIASANEYRAKTANNLLDTSVWDAAATVALSDTATVAVDMSTGFNFTLTLGGNRTLGQPTNTKVGQSGFIQIVQDGTGSRTLAYHADWKFADGTDPVLTTTAGATDILFYQVIAANFIYATLIKAVA